MREKIRKEILLELQGQFKEFQIKVEQKIKDQPNDEDDEEINGLKTDLWEFQSQTNLNQGRLLKNLTDIERRLDDFIVNSDGQGNTSISKLQSEINNFKGQIL